MNSFDPLFLLHLCSFGTTLVMALILAFSRLQVRWINPKYERSRWLLFSAMVILVAHFCFQLKYCFYNSGDEVGGVINFLIYVPVSFSIFYSMLSIQCSQNTSLRFLELGFLIYAMIAVLFGIGCWLYGSLRIGWMYYIMFAFYMAFLVYMCVAPAKEILRRKRAFESVTGMDTLPYNRYLGISYLIMVGSSITLAISITDRDMVIIVGPCVLVALIFYVISFVALGFNIIPYDELVDDYGPKDVTKMMREAGEDKKGLLSIFGTNKLTEARIKEITNKLDIWCMSGGFKDSNIDLEIFSRRINVPRKELTSYFENHLHRSFRTWLSDVRFTEAQRILKNDPNCKNETISSECGFSSHAHLYKIFKARTNMSPKQWKESLENLEEETD